MKPKTDLSIINFITEYDNNLKEINLNQSDNFEIKISKTENNAEKSAICEFILRKLPDWFGIEESTLEYIDGVKDSEFYIASIGKLPIGFFSIKQLFEMSTEIYVCGILPYFHRKGIGAKLVNEIVRDQQSKGVKYLSVKTLSSAHPDPGYAKTRKFYEKCGFIPLEEFKTLWGESNPCLLMVKWIGN